MPQAGWTPDQIVANLLRWGNFWDSDEIGFTFLESSDSEGFVSFTQEQREATREALQAYADVIAVEFTEAADDGDGDGEISFENLDLSSYAYGVGGGAIGVSGYVGFNTAYLDDSKAIGDYFLKSLLHEIGHALGLPHPGDYNANGLDAIEYQRDALYVEDSRQYTVMSYFSASETGADHANRYASTLLLHDVAALQAVYGANMGTRTGDTVYGFGSNAGRRPLDFAVNAQPVVAIWDAGGRDSIVLSGYDMRCRLDLREGAFSDVGGLTGNVSICLGVVIEDAVGGKSGDWITGNGVGNTLSGLGGSDAIYGLAGDDVLNGGAGSDLLDGSVGRDVLSPGEGVDTVLAGDGDDRIVVAPLALTGADLVLGGTGTDTLQFYLAGAISSSRLAGVTGVEKILLAPGANSIVLGDALLSRSDSRSMIVVGNRGADRLDASTVTETYGLRLAGGAGADVLLGGKGATTFSPGSGADTVVGQDGSDRIEIRLADLDGSDRFDGGWGLNALVLLDSGVLASAQLRGLSNIREIYLGDGGNAVAVDGAVHASGLARILGGPGADFVDAGALSAEQGILFAGGEGDDVFKGGAGDDSFLGEGGIDTADYSEATARVLVNLATTGAQAIGGGHGRDTLTGVDAIEGSAFADELRGDFADNWFAGNGGNDFIAGGGGTDTASYRHATSAVVVDLTLQPAQAVGGGQGSDTLRSIEGLEGSAFSDTLKGNASDNLLIGGAGNDILQGGTGSDTAGYGSATAGVRVNLSLSGAQSVGGGQGADRLLDIENLLGSSFADRLIGSSSANRLSGGGGDDNITGAGGADTLEGGAGNDLLAGGEGADYVDDGAGDDVARGDGGDDTLWDGPGNDSLHGGDGDDFVYLGSGRNLVDGGAGVDGVDFYFWNAAIVVDLRKTGAQDIGPASATIINVENVFGGKLADRLIGSAAANSLHGGSGDDRISGLGGNDRLDGGRGRDVLEGGDGYDTLSFDRGEMTSADRVHGGSDFDTLYLWGDYSAGLVFGPETIVAVERIALAGGDSYKLVLHDGNVASGAELEIDAAPLAGAHGLTLDGSAERNGRLRTTGGQGDDALTGGSMNDNLNGSGGNDRLAGGGGADWLDGGRGEDVLKGGRGVDDVLGGGGADRFVFDDLEAGATRATADRIGDFAGSTGDRIDLERIDANSKAAGDQDFIFIGTAAFSKAAGELRYDMVSGHTYLHGDTDGDGAADFYIRLEGTTAIVADFLII